MVGAVWEFVILQTAVSVFLNLLSRHLLGRKGRENFRENGGDDEGVLEERKDG